MVEKPDWFDIDQEEEISWIGQPHKNSLYPAVIIGVPLSILGIGLFIIAYAYLHRENTDYVVSNKGLYKKTGIISRRVKRIKFDKVQDISYSQSYLGRVFDYGNVDISTAGGSQVEMRFRSVPNPTKVQELISKEAESSGSVEEPEYSEKDILVEILSELKHINEKLE